MSVGSFFNTAYRVVVVVLLAENKYLVRNWATNFGSYLFLYFSAIFFILIFFLAFWGIIITYIIYSGIYNQ